MPTEMNREAPFGIAGARLDEPGKALRRAIRTRQWRLVHAAMRLAVELHHGQRRRSGEPYINHPLRVAMRLIQLGVYEEHIIAAALLHDVLEDCIDRFDASATARFYALDRRTIDIVQLVTKRQAEPSQYFSCIAASYEASLIKLADRADNLATMIGAFSPDGARKYIHETQQHIMPIAMLHRNRRSEHDRAIGALTWEIQSSIARAKKFFDLETPLKHARQS